MNVKQYARKPSSVEAIRIPDIKTHIGFSSYKEFIHTVGVLLTGTEWKTRQDGSIDLRTTSGWVNAKPGFWIVRGDSDAYPISHEDFTKLYEEDKVGAPVFKPDPAHDGETIKMEPGKVQPLGQKPSLGRIVIFRDIIGSGYVDRPAIITAVVSPMTVNLHVFGDTADGTPYVSEVIHSESMEPGYWHWPPRT